MKLTAKTLSDLPSDVAVPTYDRSRVSPSILHIGVGNFHRAHQAVYLNELLNKTGSTEWGLRGAGVRATDGAMRTRLAAQDWLSTVVENDASGLKATVVGAMVDFIPVAPDHGPLIAAIADPVTRIVSLTVTEGGYFVNPSTGQFDPKNSDIAHDGANPTSPTTVFGALVAGLVLRQKAGLPVTIMSCDNLPGNGQVTKAAVIGLAELSDPKLATWITQNVTFPNSMVDRITPATSPREIQMVQDNFGYEDAAPVFCEPFRQWVLEDSFAAGRPAWEEVGVTITPLVHDYEMMKIRVLNGGHALIAYAGGLAGINFVHDATADPMIAGYLHKAETDDILPLVKPVPEITPEDYLTLTISRFANPGVGDTLTRLCFDGTNRQPKFIIPSIRENLARGHVPLGLILGSALWARYCLGVDDTGKAIGANDPNWDGLQAVARRAEADPLVWLEQESTYGDLRSSKEVCAAFASAYESVRTNGALGALRDYIAG